ncbi:MAG: EF-hand domain-containing protein [Mangrovicoccus sp.]
MTGYKLSALTALIVAGLALPALADRGAGDMGGFGPKGDRGGNFQAMLTEMDSNKDGDVTQAEFDAFRAARFSEIDADGNGTVSAEELSAHRLNQMQDRIETGSKIMVLRLDADKDGVLSADELQSGRKIGAFQRLDANNDGTVTAEELAQAPRMHKGMDKDRGHHGERGGWSK